MPTPQSRVITNTVDRDLSEGDCVKSRGEEIGEAIGSITGFIGAAVIGIWGLWCTWIAFAGGTFPIPFVTWESPGNFWLGLLFLFIVTPVLTAIGSQVFALAIGLPVAMLVGALTKDRN